MTASLNKVIDTLSGLLRAEQIGVFHFMAEADTYISSRFAEMRRPLRQMVEAAGRREGELAAAIVDLGGTLRPPPLSPEMQYMAYLSVGYLLPKLVLARQQTIHRYEQALEQLRDAPPEVVDLLRKHLAELREELAVLQKAANAPAQRP